MSRFLRLLLLPVVLILVVKCDTALSQDSPVESLKTLRPADGVEVSLWASEPMVNNPTSMDVDSRGRVWIAEGLNYRMKQKQFDTLRRVDGADRIKVLSDTDGDGQADKVTVFADNIFPVPLGLAVEEIWQSGKQTGTRVYIGNSPDLLVLEDTDGDDKADRRYALLTGFRGVDSDHGLHGMAFGPDGKLYFTVGDARYGADKVQAREPTFDVTDKSGRRLSASNFGTTLRVNRDGSQLEVLTSGHRNNYQAAIDSFGNVFGSDNDDDGNRGCRMYWVMDGGQYGYQHPDSSRHWAEELPGIIPKLVGTGNGAPGGLTVYQGELLPKKYFGAVLQIDSGTHQVNAHPLARHGAGFRSDYEILLKGDDAWFRPVDLSVAPDGSLFVCDWYDAGVGGNRFSDQTTGRIYRLTASGAKQQPTQFDGTNAIEALRSPNTVTRLAARETLLSAGEDSRRGLLELFGSDRSVDRARALHVLFDLPNTGVDDVVAALNDSEPRIRETAVRLLARDATREFVVQPVTAQSIEPPAQRFLDQILPLADDNDAGVRRALLMAVRNVPTSNLGGAISKLAATWDGRDRYYLEALRAGIVNRETQFVKRLFDSLTDQAIESGWNNQSIAVPPYYPVGTNDAFLRPQDELPLSNAASRVVGLAWVLQRPESIPALRRLLKQNQSPTVEQAATIALVGIAHRSAGELLIERYLADGVSEDRKRDILRQLGAGVAGAWSDLAKQDSLRNVFATALDDRTLQIDAMQAIARAKLSEFGEQMLPFADDASLDMTVRVAAITSLGKLKYDPVRRLARELVDASKGEPSGGPLSLAALDALQAFARKETQASLMQILVDAEMPLDVRRQSLRLVSTSAAGAEQVLSQHKAQSIPADLHSELVFLLHNHSDRRIRSMAENELPIGSGSDGKKIHNVQTVLALQGNASRGGELFQNHKEAACARCHRVTGEGSLVGPDLASVGMKYGDKELLYHIQFPSGAINYNFVAHTFLLNDGRVLNGLVIDRSGGQIKLGIATGQHITIAADEIEEERPQSVSLMPAGLVANFTEQQLADLVEYLLTLRQGDAIRTTKE
jgi:putative membrane-bound dehydrogenase-like protein